MGVAVGGRMLHSARGIDSCACGLVEFVELVEAVWLTGMHNAEPFCRRDTKDRIKRCAAC